MPPQQALRCFSAIISTAGRARSTCRTSGPQRLSGPFIALRGNHERLMLERWLTAGEHARLVPVRRHRDDTVLWRRHRQDDARRRWRMRGGLQDKLPAHHRAFLEGTRLSSMMGDYFFVHAGARPGVALDRQDVRDLLWISDEFSARVRFRQGDCARPYAPSPSPRTPRAASTSIPGAFKWGVLSAVALEAPAPLSRHPTGRRMARRASRARQARDPRAANVRAKA